MKQTPKHESRHSVGLRVIAIYEVVKTVGLILVAIAAISVDWLHLNPLAGGVLLVVGSLLILVEAVTREAKRSAP